ncbi:MAG: YibE/F family protein [Patescibacteria group bacterium]
MKNLIFKIVLIATFGLILLTGIQTKAQDNTPPNVNQYYKGYVRKVISVDISDETNYRATLEVELTEGPSKGQFKEVNFEKVGRIQEGQKIAEGDRVIVMETSFQDELSYFVVDKYRLDSIYLIVILTILVTVAVSGWKGINSILGLIISILILLRYLIPNLQIGQNPIVIGLTGSVAIAFASMYLAHGFNRKTTVSLIATFLTISIAIMLSVWAVDITYLFGLGTEEAFYLQANESGTIDVTGLLLAGIIVGTLGILDDITISQVSIVEEIHDVDNSINLWSLIKRGMNVGKDHIASLINTLALAYAGVSLPLLLTFSITQNQPIWVIANSEYIAEEIVRTLIGSITLIIAVPISTFLGAYFIKYPPAFLKYLPKSKHHRHSHHQ